MNITKLETMNRTTINTNPCTITKFTVSTFMNPTYFCLERSHHDKINGMYCFVLDKRKLGIMTDEQIKDYDEMFRYFIPHGYPIRSLQNVNIALYFEMGDDEGFNPAKEVNMGLYDLDNDVILTKVNRWSKDCTYNAGTERFPDEAWEDRKRLYTEWERIGKTSFVK